MSNRSSWESRNSVTLDYHWRDRDKLAADHEFLENLYEEVLRAVSEFLNEFHNTDHNIGYWRIILGPWLLTYVAVLWDRWESLSVVQTIEGKLTTKTLTGSAHREIASDYSAAIDLFDTDLWNHQLFSAILEF